VEEIGILFVVKTTHSLFRDVLPRETNRGGFSTISSPRDDKMQTFIKLSSSAPSSPQPHARRESGEMQQSPQRRSRLVFASPRLQQEDGDLFPTVSSLQEHEERWKYLSEQAGSHRQESHVLRVNRNMTPKALQHGTPRQAAARITELHLWIQGDTLPEWLDVVGQTFFHLEHLYLNKAVDAETKTPHSVKRLYILYRLPRLKSINGVNVTFAERALARPNNPNGRRVKREDWMDSSLLDFVDDEIEYTADDSDDDEDRKTSVGIEVDLVSDTSSSVSSENENIKILKAIERSEQKQGVNSNQAEVDFSSTASIAEERNDVTAMLEKSLIFNRIDVDGAVKEDKKETTEMTHAESDKAVVVEKKQECNGAVPNLPTPPSVREESSDDVPSPLPPPPTKEEKARKTRRREVAVKRRTREERAVEQKTREERAAQQQTRVVKTTQHRTREDRAAVNQTSEDEPRQRRTTEDRVTKHPTREDRTLKPRPNPLLPRGRRSGIDYFPLPPHQDERSENKTGDGVTCLPSLPEKLRRDLDCLEYVEAESSAACEWSAACGTLALFRSKGSKGGPNASKSLLRLSFRRKDARNEAAKRPASVYEDFKQQTCLSDEEKLLLGIRFEPPPSMSPLNANSREMTSPSRVEKLLDSVWTPPKGQKVSPAPSKDLSRSPCQVACLDHDGIPPIPNHSVSPGKSPVLSKSPNRHASIMDQEEGTALAANFPMQPRMSPGKTSPVPYTVGNVSPAPSPTSRLPASKSLSSPFPMQFRHRAASCSSRELSVSTKFNERDGPAGPVPPPIPRARSPSLVTMETIEAPLPLNRVQSSPSKLAGRKLLQSQKFREDLPPPCPGGPSRIPAAPTAKRKKKGKGRRWREQLSARSTSIIDGEETDESEEMSDEENVAAQGQTR